LIAQKWLNRIPVGFSARFLRKNGKVDYRQILAEKTISLPLAL